MSSAQPSHAESAPKKTPEGGSSAGPTPRANDSRPTLDSLRLPEQTLDKLHQVLEQASTPSMASSNASKRKWRRWSMTGRSASATFVHPGGTTVRCVVSPRTLSAGGIGMLHGGFVYPGTQVTVHLRALTKETRDIAGKVVSCRHIGKHIHEVGVQFIHQIEPRDFLSLTENDDSFLLEHVDPNSLQGRVMVIEASRLDQRVIAHLLKGTRLEVEFFEDPAAATSAAQTFDLIMVNQDMSPTPGIDVVTMLREAQVVAPALLFASDDGKELQQRARDAGVSAIVRKPLNAHALHRAAAEFLVLRGALSLGAGAIASTLRGNEDMRDLIECFVREADRLADEVDDAVRAGDTDKVRAVCVQLRGAGSSHGFAVVSEAAGAALTALNAAQTLNRCANEVRRLVEVCRRCTTG